MELGRQLDSFGGSRLGHVVISIFLVFALASGTFPQENSTLAARVAGVKELYEEGRWEEVLQATQENGEGLADLALYRGLALAHLERWSEAERTFEAGLRRNPRDTRFLDELAGLAYRVKDFSRAKKDLRRSLEIDASGAYAAHLLAAIYFLEGNLDAALKYWNRIGEPQLSELTFDPRPRLRSILLDRAFQFARGAEWSSQAYLRTRALLEGLDIFAWMRFDLQAQPGGRFDLVFGSIDEPSWREAKWQNALKLLRGTPYQTVYPEFRNLNSSGLNWLSAYRWDDEKRWVRTEVAGPIRNDPGWRYRFYFDGRNENWNISTTLLPLTPSPAGVNVEKISAGLELRSIPGGEWSWSAGLLVAYRRFRNQLSIPAQVKPFFEDNSNLGYQMQAARTLVQIPERRFTLESRARGEAGTFFRSPLGRYARLQADLDSTWYPRARGDDYQMRSRLRAGRTFGDAPLDELFVLGFDRDTDLWMRGHPGLNDGQKGAAPLGRGYILGNWEIAKVVYSMPFVSFRMGPFVDTGATYDPSGYFGSRKWMYDTGVQAKIKILGSFEFVLGYGKDLRSGKNSFFTTVSR